MDLNFRVTPNLTLGERMLFSPRDYSPEASTFQRGTHCNSTLGVKNKQGIIQFSSTLVNTGYARPPLLLALLPTKQHYNVLLYIQHAM